MRILYLAYSRLPTEKAHGLQIMKTCEALAERGTEVELVIPERHNSLRDDPFEYYGAKKIFRLRSVSSPDLVRFSAVGFVLSVIFFSETVRFLKIFWQADYLYSRDPLLLAQYLLLSRPFVFEAHQPPSLLRLLVAKRAAKVVVISQALAEEYQKQGVHQSRILVAPDGVDVAQFSISLSKQEARVALQLPLDQKIAVYTGHLYERKGVHTLAEAVQLSGIAAYIVGGLAEDVRSFNQRYRNVENLHVLGYRPPSEIPLWLRAADVLILPNSQRDPDSAYYTSPMKLSEYLASGTPIIASEVPALSGLFGSATYVPPDNAQALAEALRGSWVPSNKAPYTWSERARTILEAL